MASETKSHEMRCYRITNSDGKVWVIPAESLRMAMALYQPSGWKGRMLKNLFPCLHWSALVRRITHAEVMSYEFPEDVRMVCEQCFRRNDLEYAMFLGTPSLHRKTTIQVYHKRKIFGYCKLTDSDEVAKLFDAEQDVLQRLERQKIEGVPRCLYNGRSSNGRHLFLQTTAKTLESKVVHEWNGLMEKFLNDLYRSTSVRTLFELTDFYSTLQSVRLHPNWLCATVDTDLYIKTMDGILQRYTGTEVEFGFYHGDFTPWNMFVENEQLFVFDWEYARQTYPKGLDRYHFLTQTAIFERHLTAQQIIAEIASCDWVNKDDYMMYLIDIIARYTLREKGNYDAGMRKCMETWNGLVKWIWNNKINVKAEEDRNV